MNLPSGICYAAEAGNQPISNTIQVIKDPDLIIRVKQDNKVIQEKKLYLDDLEGMKLTRQTYTSIDADETPQLICAEGIPLTDVLTMMNVKFEDVQSFNLHSKEGWDRGLTKKFLFNVPRSTYPEILPKQQLSADGQPIPVPPMLTFRCYEELMGVAADWGKLNTSYGIRICFGQVNPHDECSSLYGTHIDQLEININASSGNDKSGSGNAGSIQGGIDNAAQDETVGSITDPETGKTIEVPSTLTIKAGYFGQEYTEIKTFTLAELYSLPLVKQAYTMIDKNSKVIVETTVGIRLVDLLAAAGIDPNSVQVFHLYTQATEGDTGVSLTKTFLLDFPRYFYPRLASSWDGGPMAGAARGAVRVDTIIALKDCYSNSAKVPDFYKLYNDKNNKNNRFRLVFGQINTTGETASLSLPWIQTIAVQISGMPTGGIGNMISAGHGVKGSDDSQDGSLNQMEKLSMGKDAETMKTEASGTGYSKGSIYTVVPAGAIPVKAAPIHNKLMGMFVLGMFIVGCITQYFGYWRDRQLLHGRVR